MVESEMGLHRLGEDHFVRGGIGNGLHRLDEDHLTGGGSGNGSS